MPRNREAEFELVKTVVPAGAKLLCAFVGGSELHGAKVEGKDDSDWYGMFAESPDRALGLSPLEHAVYSTSGNHAPNTAEDVDVVLYSLRKWTRLAVKGNPTILHYLFCEPNVTTPEFDSVQQNRELFLCRDHAKPFLGYAQDQMKRLEANNPRNVNRRELVYEYGFDTKYAMHVIRLLDEGLQLLTKGEIVFPSPLRDYLVDIRAGKVPLSAVIDKCNELTGKLESAMEDSPLPEKIDGERVSRFISDLYLSAWGR